MSVYDCVITYYPYIPDICHFNVLSALVLSACCLFIYFFSYFPQIVTGVIGFK